MQLIGLRSCQPRPFSRKTRAKATSPFGSSPQAAPQPTSQPAINRLSEHISTAVVSGVLSVCGTYLLTSCSLSGKLDRLTEEVDKNSKDNLEKVDKLSKETAGMRREVAETKGGFRILLDEFLTPKK